MRLWIKKQLHPKLHIIRLEEINSEQWTPNLDSLRARKLHIIRLEEINPEQWTPNPDSLRACIVVNTRSPSWGYLKVDSSETLSIFADKFPQNGSKNDLLVPRTTMGCPHEAPHVATPATLNPQP